MGLVMADLGATPFFAKPLFHQSTLLAIELALVGLGHSVNYFLCPLEP